MNLYTVLGVESDAPLAAIKKEYRRLSKIYHPDNQKTGDEKSFREINEAWKVLSDPERRKRYDETGDATEKVDQREEFIRFGVIQALTVMLKSFIESGFDLAEIDAVDLMKREMIEKRQILTGNEQKAARILKKSHGMADRMKLKAVDNDNPIAGILQKICDENKKKHDDSEDHLEVHRRMTLFLNAYDYDFDAAAAAAEKQKQLRDREFRITFRDDPYGNRRRP